MTKKILLILDRLNIELGEIKDTGYYIRKNLIKLMNDKNTIVYKRDDLEKINSIDDINYFLYTNRYDNILEIFDNLKNINLSYTKENVENCISWFKYVDKKYLKRNIEIVKKKDLFCVMDKYMIDNKIFLKSVNKSKGSRVYNLETKYSLSSLKLFLNLLNDNDLLFVSEPIDMKKDEYGCVEYRCFVDNNGNVKNISRRMYENYNEIYDLSIIKKFVEELYLRKFSYCSIDIGMDNNNNLFLVEINPIIASGIYYNNDLTKL